MDIFISSDNRQGEFIDAVLDEINRRQEAARESNIDIRPIYPPRGLGRQPASLFERINQIRTASLVMMNVTPIGSLRQTVNDTVIEIPVINSGVAIEFGILMGINRIEKCHLFCSTTFRRGTISPLFLGQNIDAFDSNDTTALKAQVGTYIAEFLRRCTDEFEHLASDVSFTNPT